MRCDFEGGVYYFKFVYGPTFNVRRVQEQTPLFQFMLSIHMWGCQQLPNLFSVKIINPVKKAEYMIQKLHGVKSSFQKVDEIKETIEEYCDEYVSVPIDSLGYVALVYCICAKGRFQPTERSILIHLGGAFQLLSDTASCTNHICCKSCDQ